MQPAGLRGWPLTPGMQHLLAKQRTPPASTLDSAGACSRSCAGHRPAHLPRRPPPPPLLPPDPGRLMTNYTRPAGLEGLYTVADQVSVSRWRHASRTCVPCRTVHPRHIARCTQCGRWPFDGPGDAVHVQRHGTHTYMHGLPGQITIVKHWLCPALQCLPLPAPPAPLCPWPAGRRAVLALPAAQCSPACPPKFHPNATVARRIPCMSPRPPLRCQPPNCLPHPELLPNGHTAEVHREVPHEQNERLRERLAERVPACERHAGAEIWAIWGSIACRCKWQSPLST